MIEIRRTFTHVEDIFHEFGPPAAEPLQRGFVAAVLSNPFAGRYEPDILPMMEALNAVGTQMLENLNQQDLNFGEPDAEGAEENKDDAGAAPAPELEPPASDTAAEPSSEADDPVKALEEAAGKRCPAAAGATQPTTTPGAPHRAFAFSATHETARGCGCASSARPSKHVQRLTDKWLARVQAADRGRHGRWSSSRPPRAPGSRRPSARPRPCRRPRGT